MSYVSIMLGGMFAARHKFTLQQHTKFVFVCVSMSTLALVPMLFLECEQRPVADAPYQNMCVGLKSIK
mgnify:FL=1